MVIVQFLLFFNLKQRLDIQSISLLNYKICERYRTNMMWPQERQWCINNLKGKSFKNMVCKLALQCVVAAIWYERNSRTFEKQSCTVDAIYFQVMSTIMHRVNTWRKIKKSKKNWNFSIEWGFSQLIFT